MTAPRYECVAARNVIESVMQEVGIPLTISGGVYYGQCMQMMLEDLIGQSVNYAITVDFDSIFQAAHVHRLISVIVQEQTIDAIAAVQPKRNGGSVLASTGKAESLLWDGFPLKVKTAHFGLTIIDLIKLAQVPKPWFLAQPNEQGEWGNGHVDPDVYFWQSWGIAGHSIYIDPGCRLGHMEEMVTYYNADMQLQHRYLKDWKDEISHVDSPLETVSSGQEVGVA